MAILIPKRWARQPPYNTGIDWSNPLTRGLQSLWRFDQLVDAVQNKRFGITDSTDMTKSSPTMFGVGTKREAASTLGTGYIDLNAPLTSDFTLLTVHVPTSGGQLLDYDGSPRTLQFKWFSNNGVQLIYFNTAGSPFFSTITGDGSFVNRLCVSAAVKKGALITAYNQGIAGPSDTITGTPQSPPTVLRAFNRRDATYAGYNGVQIYSAWYNRALSSEEIAQISENPWQLFRPQSQQLAFFSSALAPITGTLNVTEADDTLASTGALAIAGSLSVTEASDSVSSTGALAIAGSLSVTEDSDTVSSTGTLALAGSLSVTEESDSLSSTGALSISGSLSVTEEGDTLSSTGSAAGTGSLNVTEESDTLSSTGALAIAGSLAVTEESDTLAATGTLSISGSLSVTEEDDALASTGALAISGSLSVTEDDDTLASAGTSGGVGSLNVTEEGDTLTATATVTQLVGGGGMGKQKRQRGWANERARLEASLKTETAAQEVKTATKILRASDSESARRVADLVREYESARATLEQLRDEVERLRVETDRSERLRDEVETAAKVVEIFAQEEAELLEILDIIDEMESRALLAALGIAA